jgi:predicted cobalt transporter CbtA
MVTRRMKIRRQLRSVRASALSEEERRQELREAEARDAHDHSDAPAESAASPRAAGQDGTPRLPDAGAERAGVRATD